MPHQTPEDVLLIEGSISKWSMIAYGLARDLGPTNCALCLKYHNVDNCHGCPVSESTGNSACEGTPYWYFYGATHDPYDDEYYVDYLWENLFEPDGLWDYDRDEACDACEAELDFLISLLPNDHRWRK